MGTIGKVVLSLEAESAAFTRGTKDSGKSLRDLGDGASKAEKDLGGMRSALESLKASAGRGSTLDELGKTLRGAGAVAGISLIGEAVNHVAEKVTELNREWEKGNQDAAGIAAELGKSIPIVGSFISAGQSIRELFTHEKEQIDDINAEIKSGNALMQERVKIQSDVKRTQDEIAESIRRANEQLALANATSPEDRARVEEQNRKADTAANDAKEFEEKARIRRDAMQVELDDIRKHGEDRKKILEDDAHEKLSFYDKHSYNDDAEKAAEDARRLADAQADSITQIELKAAQTRAKNDIDQFKNGLAEQAALRDKALEKEAQNAQVKKVIKDAGSDLKSFLDEIAKAGTEVNKAADAAKHKAFEEQERNLEGLKRELDDLKKEARQSGMTESQKKLDDLKEAHADPAMIKEAEGLTAQIEKMQAWKKEQEDANRLIEESMTPQEKYQQTIDKVQKLFKDGLITAQQQSDAIKKAQEQIAKADKKQDERHDVAASTRRFDFNLPADRQPKVGEQQLATARQALAESQKQTGFLSDLWRFGNDQNQNQDEIVDF